MPAGYFPSLHLLKGYKTRLLGQIFFLLGKTYQLLRSYLHAKEERAHSQLTRSLLEIVKFKFFFFYSQLLTPETLGVI